MADAFNGIFQERVQCVNADEWTEVTIQPGSRHPMLILEDDTVRYRVTFDNSLNPTDQGIPMNGGDIYTFEGVNSVHLTVYVSSQQAGAFIILQYTKE